MIKFIRTLLLFSLLFCLITEIIIRVFRLTSDVPRRRIDSSGIQDYIPNQAGYFKNAKEKWVVNKYGWTGVSDLSKETKVSIIGDSYIENLMNPIRFHQGYILDNELSWISFFEAGRSGASFIEAFAIAEKIDNEICKFDKHLIYVEEKDFSESLTTIRRKKDVLQYNPKANDLAEVKLKSPQLKKILYSSKLLYYSYLRFWKHRPITNENNTNEPIDEFSKYKEDLYSMMKYIELNFDLDRIILVFHPDTDSRYESLANEFNFKSLKLRCNNLKEWQFSHDKHWNHYGHTQAALQVADYLKKEM